MVESVLGTGGMGEVYRGRDARLQRSVAIKVLPERVASDPDRVARFAREAQTLAALNHPHIAQIYGLEESGSTRALVMELVDGETLADRLTRGPIPLHDALPIARQIADAVEAAHEAGIIHRDLKPSNIKVRPDGTVKVLDFGLAKGVASPNRTDSDVAISPTITSPAMTHAGVVLGTAAYMSPEQAKGQAVDRRTDVWAFGCVLYEMLAGRRAFGGDDVTETLASVLRNDPDWRALPAHTPASVRTAIERCLQKQASARLPHVSVARVLLDDSITSQISRPEITRRGRRLAVVAAVTALALIAVATALAMRSSVRASQPPIKPGRYALPLPKGVGVLGHQSIALSAMGDFVVFSGTGETRSLFVQRLGTLDAAAIIGTTDATEPALDPTGRWVAFRTGTRLKKIPLEGGVPTTLCEFNHPHGIAWGPDGRIYFAPEQGARGIWSVSADGGQPSPVTTVDADAGEAAHEYPQVLPDGSGLVFNVLRLGGVHAQATIVVFDFSTRTRKSLVEGGFAPKVTASGRLLFARGDTIFAATVDVARHSLSTTATPLMNGVHVNGANGTAVFDVAAQADVLIYQLGSDAADRDLVWVTPGGADQRAVTTRRTYEDIDLSPDAKRVVAVVMPTTLGPTQFWAGEPSRGVMSLFLDRGERLTTPRWAPDNSRIAFSVQEKREIRIADLSGHVDTLGPFSERLAIGGWSPDGELLVVTILKFPSSDIATLNVRTRQLIPIEETPALEGEPLFSPDGKLIVYLSDRSGDRQIEVRPYGRGGAPVQISTRGGSNATWSPDGRTVFFRASTGEIMAAPFDGSRAAPVATPVAVSRSGYRFAVARDGRILQVVSPQGDSEPLVVFHGFSASISSNSR